MINELRKGNWLNDPYDEPTQVDITILNYIDKCNHFKQKVDRYSFIHFTKKWLKKCKLPKWIRVDIYENIVNDDYFTVEIGTNHPDGGYIWTTLPKKYKYVHQLQNLYFALVGKELEWNRNTTQ